jgi:hypothetical protein
LRSRAFSRPGDAAQLPYSVDQPLPFAQTQRPFVFVGGGG